MYSELCEKLYEQNADNYVAVFNELDKYLDTIVSSEKFLPFNEKIKEIAKGRSQIALFIKKYQVKLKYFGELRNHIAHGFKLDGKHYATPSYHALDELRKYKDAIMQPVTVGSVFKKQVFTCMSTDTVQEVIQSMRNFHYTHVPVYNETHELQGVLSQGVIFDWIAMQKIIPEKDLTKIYVGDLDLTLGNERYEFIPENTSLFSVPLLFEQKDSMQKGLHQKLLGSLFITQHGDISEEILGVITVFDLPMITQSAFVDKE